MDFKAANISVSVNWILLVTIQACIYTFKEIWKRILKHHTGRGNKCIGHIYGSIIKPSHIYEEEGSVYSFS